MKRPENPRIRSTSPYTRPRPGRSALLCFCLALILPLSQLHASIEPARIQLNLKQNSFDAALDAVSRASGMTVDVRGDKPTGMVNVNLAGATFEEAVKALMSAANVRNYSLAQDPKNNKATIWILRSAPYQAAASLWQAPARSPDDFTPEELALIVVASANTAFPGAEDTEFTPEELALITTTSGDEIVPGYVESEFTPEELALITTTSGDEIVPGYVESEFTPEEMAFIRTTSSDVMFPDYKKSEFTPDELQLLLETIE